MKVHPAVDAQFLSGPGPLQPNTPTAGAVMSPSGTTGITLNTNEWGPPEEIPADEFLPSDPPTNHRLLSDDIGVGGSLVSDEMPSSGIDKSDAAYLDGIFDNYLQD